jgi:hypothetical protein
MSDKRTEKQAIQDAIRTAVDYLTIDQRKMVLSFIILLPHQWTSVINESVKALTVAQCREVLEFIATMPGEGNGDIHPKSDQTSL